MFQNNNSYIRFVIALSFTVKSLYIFISLSKIKKKEKKTCKENSNSLVILVETFMFTVEFMSTNS